MLARYRIAPSIHCPSFLTNPAHRCGRAGGAAGFVALAVTLGGLTGCGLHRPLVYDDDLPEFIYTKRTLPVAWHVGPIEVTLGHLRTVTRPPRARALLIHGLGQNERTMLPLAHRLAGDGIDVMALRIPDCTDVPGGIPSIETGWKTIDQAAGVLLRVVQTSSPQPDLYWGRGLGASVLFRAADRFPEHFDEARAVVIESPIFADHAGFTLVRLDAQRGRVRDGAGQRDFVQRIGQVRAHNLYVSDQLQPLVPGYSSADAFIRHVDAALDDSNALGRPRGSWWHQSIWVLGLRDPFARHGTLVTRLRSLGVPMRRILTYDTTHFVSLTQDVWADVHLLLADPIAESATQPTTQPAGSPGPTR